MISGVMFAQCVMLGGLLVVKKVGEGLGSVFGQPFRMFGWCG